MLRVLHGITGLPGRDDRSKAMAAASFRQASNMLDRWQTGDDKVAPIKHNAAV